MLQIILWVLLAAVIGFLAVIFVRAAMFSPKPEGKPSGEQVTVEEEKVIQDMAEMIRCKTVSYNDESLIDKEEFRKFQELLPKVYPEIHSRLSRQFIGVNGMLYHWKGKNEGRPVVLMWFLWKNHSGKSLRLRESWRMESYGAEEHWIQKELSAGSWKQRNSS